MTVTNDERREVARRLREYVDMPDGWWQETLPQFYIEKCVFGDLTRHSEDELFARLADLIEPERTCHMVCDYLTDTVYCDVCGERFDSVAQYMAMGPNGFSTADYKGKYKDAKFCPNCGAKVVKE